MTPINHITVKFVKHPKLPHVELRFSHYRTQTFNKHTHDTYSIGIVSQGRTNFIHQNQAMVVGSGDIALINPAEAHACNPEPGSMLTYFMLYIEPLLMKKIASDLSGSTSKTPCFSKPVIKDTRLHRTLSQLCNLLIQYPDDLLEIESGLYESLSELLLNYGSEGDTPLPQLTGNLEVLKAGQQFLVDYLDQNISLQELASICGLSPYHFLRTFRNHFGLPPHAYQLQQRINRAKRLLHSNMPIIEVATKVGFADQSHFTRKFKASVGATPRQYQLAIQ